MLTTNEVVDEARAQYTRLRAEHPSWTRADLKCVLLMMRDLVDYLERRKEAEG